MKLSRILLPTARRLVLTTFLVGVFSLEFCWKLGSTTWVAVSPLTRPSAPFSPDGGEGVSSSKGAFEDSRERDANVFTDVTNEAGITWKHFNGESEDRFLIETSSGGVGFIDFDNDGLLDLFFVNGGETPKGKSQSPIRHSLYRNQGNGRFKEVAAMAGVDALSLYGMGVAAADYDNDGFQDLFITGYPSCVLFHNNKDGMFTDVTAKAGVQNPGKWSASAAWFDYDRDGLLDIFVCNYTELSFSDSRRCEMAGQRSYCNPIAYEGQPSTLYHNQGDGTFQDVTSQSGISKLVGRGFGVVSIDVNDDGWPDLFVARDTSSNLLLINQKNGTFKDFASQAETAYNPDGMARAGMGVDAGDLNGDGWPDFVVTNFNDEYHALYLNGGKFPYEEWTRESGLAGLTKFFVGWGIHFIDYDNDSNLDLIIVNGHPNKTIELTRQDVTYMEPPLLLANRKGIFHNMKETAGPAFHTSYSSRGLAVGDYDNDGDTDVVFVCLNSKPVLLRNNVGQDVPWIGFQLEGTRSNRDAIGAKLTVRIGERKIVRWLTGGASFLASHDKRVLFGLGTEKVRDVVSVEIQWPSGETQTISALKPNRYHRIVETPGLRVRASASFSTQGNATAQQHADRGMQLAQAGDLKNAESELRKALELSPNHPLYLSTLGGILGMQQRLEEAAVYFKKALKIDPTEIVTRRNLAANQWQLGRLQEASENLQRILKARPADRPSMLLLGMVCENLKDYAQAAHWLSAVPELVQQRPESISALAKAYYQTHQTEKARVTLAWLQRKETPSQGIFMGGQVAADAKDYETAQTLFASIASTYPDQMRLGYSMALLSYRTDRFDQSQQKLQSLIAAGQASSEIYNMLGWCFYKQNQTREALRVFEQAIDLEPLKESNYLDLGMILASEKPYWQAALAVARNAAEKIPASARIHEMKGMIEIKLQQYTDAIGSYNRSLELNASNSAANIGLATAQWAAGLIPEAAATFEKGIRQFPGDAAHYQEYARMLLKLEESGGPSAEPRVVALLETAIKLDSSLSDPFYQLGNLALSKGRFQEAVKHLEVAARLNPKSRRTHYALARVYRRLGRSGEAAKEMQVYQKFKDEEERSPSGMSAGVNSPG